MEFKENSLFSGLALPVLDFNAESLPARNQEFLGIAVRIRDIALNRGGPSEMLFFVFDLLVRHYRSHGETDVMLESLAELIVRCDEKSLMDFIEYLALRQRYNLKNSFGVILKEAHEQMKTCLEVGLEEARPALKEWIEQRKLRGSSNSPQQSDPPSKYVELDKVQSSGIKEKWLEDLKKSAAPARLFQKFDPSLLEIQQEFPNLTEFIEEIRYQVSSGNFSPVLLVGPPGVGKTYIQGILAKALDFPYFSLNIASEDSPWTLSGNHGAWRDGAHSELLRRLLLANTDFMYVFLDEINANLSDASRNYPIGPVLLDFFDSQNRFKCNYLKHEYSTKNWIKVAAVNDLSTINRQLLDRFTVIHVSRPTLPQRLAIVQRMLSASGVPADPGLIELLAAETRSLRSVKKEIDKLAHYLQGRPATEMDIARLTLGAKKEI